MGADRSGISPLNLFQERYDDRPWHLLCCCICLNLSSGRALESVHEDLFELWPTPLHLATADVRDVTALMSQLGLQNRRARNLMRMSVAFACWWDGIDPRELPGIGRYGCDSYNIFIRGWSDVVVHDKELRKYLEWKRS